MLAELLLESRPAHPASTLDFDPTKSRTRGASTQEVPVSDMPMPASPRAQRLVIVGAVAAGTSVGAKARRNDEEMEIVIYERDRDISYSGCGLPYFIGGTVPEGDGRLKGGRSGAARG